MANTKLVHAHEKKHEHIQRHCFVWRFIWHAIFSTYNDFGDIYLHYSTNFVIVYIVFIYLKVRLPLFVIGSALEEVAVLPRFRIVSTIGITTSIYSQELKGSKLTKSNSITSTTLLLITGNGNINSNSSYSGSNNSTLFTTLLSTSFLFNSSISSTSTSNFFNSKILDTELERPATFYLSIYLITSLLYLRILAIIDNNYKAKQSESNSSKSLLYSSSSYYTYNYL